MPRRLLFAAVILVSLALLALAAVWLYGPRPAEVASSLPALPQEIGAETNSVANEQARPPGTEAASAPIRVARLDDAGAVSVACSVIDAHGTPIEGASVSATKFGGESIRAEAPTDAAGATVLEVPSPGFFVVAASTSTMAGVLWATVSPPPAQTALEIVVGEGAMLHGDVIDAVTGAPIAGASLRIVGIEGDQSPELSGPAFAAESDVEGRFALGPLPARNAWLLAKAEGYAPLFRDDVDTASANVLVEMTPGALIAGIVVDKSTGQTVSGADVTAFAADGQRHGPAKSDGEGRFVLSGLPAGRFTLNAVAGDALTHIPPVVDLAAGEALHDFRLELDTGIRVTGRVHSEGTETPFAGVRVVASQSLDGRRWSREGYTDDAGVFTLCGFVPGACSVQVMSSSESRCIDGFAVPQAQETVLSEGGAGPGIAFALRPLARLSGVVLGADGAPVADCAVWLSPGSSKETTTGGDGSFEIGCVHPDREYTVSALHAGLTGTVHGVQPVGGDVVEVEIILTEAADGVILGELDFGPAPPQRMRVYLSALSRERTFRAPGVDTGLDGRFAFENIPYGEYRVGAQMVQRGADGAVGRVQVQVNSPDPVRVTLPVGTEGGPISGTVVDPDAKPVARADISATPDVGGLSLRTATDQNGAFSFYALDASLSYRFYVRADGYVAASHPVAAQAGASGIRLVLEPAASITAVVLDAASGQPVTRFAYSTEYQARTAVTVNDPEGRFEFASPPLPATLSLSAEGYMDTFHRITAANRDAVQEIRMEPAGAVVKGRVVTPSGAGVPWAEVTWRESEGEVTLMPPKLADGSGYFTLQVRPGRTHYITASERTHGSGVGVWDGASAEPIEIVLGGAGSIAIRLNGGSESGARQVNVYGAASSERLTVDVPYGAEHVVPNLAPGIWTVFIAEGRETLVTTEAVVADGTQTDVTLTLP